MSNVHHPIFLARLRCYIVNMCQSQYTADVYSEVLAVGPGVSAGTTIECKNGIM